MNVTKSSDPIAESNSPRDFPLYKKLDVAQYIANATEFLKTVQCHANTRNIAWLATGSV
jgi:hypothetical protein